MLINLKETDIKTIECKRPIMEYLTKIGYSVIGCDGNKYYFPYSEKIVEDIKKIPLKIKLVSLFIS